MKNPLISVVVPVYNTDRYTGICIESLINQRYKNLEIILVDDGSTDRCPDICDLYASKDSRIVVIHKKNAGLVAGRKTGVEAAKGEYIAYVDGDDWVGEGYFEAIAKTIENEEPDTVVCDWTRVLFDQKVVIHNNIKPGIYEGENLESMKSQMISKGKFYKHGISTFVWNKAFKRDIVYDCQLDVDERIMIGEDACVSYAALIESNKVAVLDNCDYHYRQHEDSMLKKKGNYHLELEKLKALNDNLAKITVGNSELKRQGEDYVLVSCIIRSGGLYPDNEHYIFGDDFVGKNVVVFSAGTFGQLFVSKILQRQSCNLVGWIDDDYWEYRRCCLNVDPVETVLDFDYDYLIIAAVDGENADDIKQRLIHLGVVENKILTMEVPENKREKLLKEYLEGEA